MPILSDELDPELSAGYNVRRCHRRFDRLMSAFLARHGLKIGFWYYLRVLWIRDGVTQKELSDMTNVAENTTASIISSMVNEGLVTRERDEVDRRKFRVSLTERGRKLQSELLHYASKINALATAGISDEELSQCLSVLQRMSGNLSEAFASLDSIPAEPE